VLNRRALKWSLAILLILLPAILTIGLPSLKHTDAPPQQNNTICNLTDQYHTNQNIKNTTLRPHENTTEHSYTRKTERG
jgi:hypothetical protein